MNAVAIPLTNGGSALVSECDYDRVRGYNWRRKVNDGREYVSAHLPGSGRRGPEVTLHRVVMEVAPKVRVDHINGLGLDNRRENLRVCSNAQNIRNQRKHVDGKTSQYKGVHRQANGMFRASITCSYKKINLGQFVSETEAAVCYDMNASKLFGEFARLNFPEAARG